MIPPLNAPPYGAKPPTPQTKPGLVNPPPRVVSPYAPRTGVTATPPPRAMSQSSHRSQEHHARPPSVPLPAFGSGSRPSSTSPPVPRGFGSPEPLTRISAQTKPPPPVVEQYISEPNNPNDDSYLMAMDNGDPTPTIASTFARGNYLGVDDSYSNNVIEDPYPPPEPDEVAETLATSKTLAPPLPTSDPYAPIKPPPASSYQPTGVSSPPRAFTSPPAGTVKPPPKAAPQVRKESLVSNSAPIPPISTGVPRDPYAPKTPPVNIAPQTMLTPAASGVIDLSHSPPNTRQPISSYDPYNPSNNLKRTDTMSSIESTHAQPYGVAPTNPYAPPASMSLDAVAVDRPQYAGYVPTRQASSNTYAPSPSLLGTNDPLGRASVRAPIFSFGFGGRVVACFHNNPGMGAFDGMAPGKPSTALSVKTLKDVIPTSAYDITDSSFPGPLFNDQGTGGATSVLQTTAALTKAKKTSILQWLEARIAEEEGGVSFRGLVENQDGSSAKAEGRVVLMKILKVWIDNDGKLSGSPAIEEAVRDVLLGPPKESSAFTEAAAIGYSYQINGPQSSGEPVVATYQVKSSSLDKVQEFLMRGDRRQAYRSALDERLWAHALLISSSVDKEAWKEVVHEFIKSELAFSQTTSNGTNPLEPNQGSRESLRIAYGLFAGDGPAALKLLVPPSTFGVAGVQTHSRLSSSITAASLDGTVSDAMSIPQQTWDRWKDLLASTIANQPFGDSSATTALGDYLLANNWVEAAHCCYLLSQGTSIFSGIGAPNVRAVLYGSPNPAFSKTFHTQLRAIELSEIAEYAISLLPIAKGQEAFHGFPHLQAYRLWHAISLAEFGELSLAKRYTDAIKATIRSTTKNTVFYTGTFLDQLDELNDRLIEAPHADKTKAWISKPTVRSLNSWIAGGIEKLIQGDEIPKDSASEGKKSLEVPPAVGPFSHYSAIASTTPSTMPSPSPSFSNLHSSAAPLGRSGSATGYRPTIPGPTNLTALHTPAPPRAASAIDYTRDRASPGPKVASAGATATSFPNPSRASQDFTGRDSDEAPKPLYAQWWSDGNDNDGVTPTMTSFNQANDAGDTGNFISLMDDDPTLVPSVSTTPSGVRQERLEDEDVEDLGFGNSKKTRNIDQEDEGVKPSPTESKGTKQANGEQPASKNAAPPAQAQKNEAQPAKGWFGWLRRGESTPKPVVAKLGQQNAFYFDEKLGKWVNKNAPADDTTAKTPLPPPSRAQTASPMHAASMGSPATLPPRAASVVAGTSGGLAPPSRPSSSLSTTSGETPSSLSDSGPPSRSSPAPPHGLPGRASVPPPRSAGQTPPPSTASPAGSVSGRPGAKRNARSRYVDVFQGS